MEDILKGTLLLGAGLAIIFFALKFGTSVMLPKFINLAKMAHDSYPELGLL